MTNIRNHPRWNEAVGNVKVFSAEHGLDAMRAVLVGNYGESRISRLTASQLEDFNDRMQAGFFDPNRRYTTQCLKCGGGTGQAHICRCARTVGKAPELAMGYSPKPSDEDPPGPESLDEVQRLVRKTKLLFNSLFNKKARK